MIHKAEYVRELIRKSIAGSLTPMEAALLKAARKIYEEEEWRRMIADALGEANEEESGDLLGDWEPDFAKIRKTADRRKRVNTIAKSGARLGLVAAALIVVLVGFHIYREYLRPTEVGGICAGLPRDMEIPASEFAGTIRYGDTTSIHVEACMSGRIAQVENLEVRRDANGTLVLTAVREANAADTVGHSPIRFITAPHQQLALLLPDGTRIRLNAESVLTYPLPMPGQAISYAHISGEAIVQVPQKRGAERAVIETANGQLQSPGGDFAVMATQRDTRATLLAGGLSIMGRRDKLHQVLDRPGNQGRIKTVAELDGSLKDLLFFRPKGSAEQAIAWTKITRNYRNASLKDFVADVSRWYGIRFKNINCIPESKRVRASICYRASLADVLAVINKAGIRVYQTNGVYSFCEPDDGFKPPVAWVDHHREVCDYCGQRH